MSMREKRAAGGRTVPRNEKMSVEAASRHTTPETHHVKSLSRPKDAEESFDGDPGAPGAAPSMSHHRTLEREGFTPHTGSVVPPYLNDPEPINGMEPGTLGGGD